MIVIAAVMCSSLGLIMGSLIPNAEAFFSTWKAGSIVLIFPVAVWIWPSFPVWAAKLSPTYYIVHPIFALSVQGDSLASVAADLTVAVAWTVILGAAAVLVARRMRRRA